MATLARTDFSCLNAFHSDWSLRCNVIGCSYNIHKLLAVGGCFAGLSRRSELLWVRLTKDKLSVQWDTLYKWGTWTATGTLNFFGFWSSKHYGMPIYWNLPFCPTSALFSSAKLTLTSIKLQRMHLSYVSTGYPICSWTLVGLTLIWVFQHIVQLPSRFCQIPTSPSRIR